MIHADSHPLAGQTVKVDLAHDGVNLKTGATYRIEDWCDRVIGRSWTTAEGLPIALAYAVRAGFGQLPLDDEVVYGKGESGLAHLVHVSELVVPSTAGGA